MYQEEGALQELTSMWGMKKTMSEKSLITKYVFINKLYLTSGNANFKEIL